MPLKGKTCVFKLLYQIPLFHPYSLDISIIHTNYTTINHFTITQQSFRQPELSYNIPPSPNIPLAKNHDTLYHKNKRLASARDAAVF